MDKPHRLIDEDAIERARQRDGCCLLGLYTQDGCTGGFDVHHIETRGSGGDDVLTNLVGLCRKHHNLVHAGYYSKNQLRWLLWRYFHYEYKSELKSPIIKEKIKKSWRGR